MFAPPSLSSKINVPHCTKMALVHDMAEALVGDITPMDEVPKLEKNRREQTTIDYFTNSLLGKVNGGIIGKEIMDIWREYEDGKTLESKFVHDVDKIELVLQMVDYERVYKRELDLGGFSYVASRIEMYEVKEWADEILRKREEFWGERPYMTFSADVHPEGKSLEQKRQYYG
jgi:putative hydrolase of HD superfamily